MSIRADKVRTISGKNLNFFILEVRGKHSDNIELTYIAILTLQ